MWDPLLRFHDRSLEAAFWSSAHMRGRLLAIDRLATVLVFINRASLCLYGWRLEADGVISTGLMRYNIAASAFHVLAQTAVMVLLYRWPRVYVQRRNMLMAFQRASRAFSSFVTSLHVAEPAVEAAWTELLVQRIGGSRLSVHYAVLKALAIRGHVAYTFINYFAFPTSFALSLPLHVAMLPTLLHTSACVARILAHRALLPTACRLATTINFLSMPAPGQCSDLATRTLAYSGTLCLGFVTPLYLAYMLEAREKLAFVRRRLLSESEREVGAEAAAARARLWRQENPKNPFACCMLYFSLLFIANVFIFLILAHVQLSMAR